MFGNATARTNIFLLPMRTYALNWKFYATCLINVGFNKWKVHQIIQ